MFSVYVLQSEKLSRFYIGSTKDLQGRLEKHLSHFYGNQNFTTKADDWFLFLSIECTSEIQARKIELHIKSMKSRKYVENLLKYPEMILRLKNQFH